jgi:SAM-dependent methyltransferase
MKDYWDCLARQFRYQQPPLRPCAEDVEVIQDIIQEQNRKVPLSNTNALLFGVTPEYVKLRWPQGTRLTAVEKSQAMIDRVWPGNILRRRRAVRGDWFDIKLKKRAYDFIVGDGFLTGLSYPGEQAQLAGRIAQWLKPGGLLIARIFVRRPEKETLGAILGDLKAGRIARFDILKWRLAMAIQRKAREGVMVGDIYRAWNRIEKEHPELSKKAGWPRLTVNTIKLYEGRTNRYVFPTVEELKGIFPSRLKPVALTFPTYDFGQCCPILVYRRSSMKGNH